MDPVSVFVITVAMLATTPTTKPKEIGLLETTPKSKSYTDSKTEFVFPGKYSGIGGPDTLKLIKVDKFERSAAINPRESLKREIVAYGQYDNDWNGPNTVGPTFDQIKAANSFVEAIPARLPLPRPMLSFNGEIGLYWDVSGGYAEASFEPDGNMSFFSRTRLGNEDFQDNINLGSLNDNWFWSSIGSLDMVAVAA